jgi:hypothetical protein
MLHVEWGRLGEIADLYVLPEFRMKGIARSLVETAIEWSRSHDCSAVAVTITREGETRHNLTRLYGRFGFEPMGRIGATLRFKPALGPIENKKWVVIQSEIARLDPLAVDSHRTHMLTGNHADRKAGAPESIERAEYADSHDLAPTIAAPRCPPPSLAISSPRGISM